MSNKPKKSANQLAKTMSLLSTQVLAMPAIAADQPIDNELGYRYSRYLEDSLPGTDVLNGSTDRYDISIHQFRFSAPLGGRFSLVVDASRENMSGASPMATIRGPDDKPLLLMTGATIEDTRDDLKVAASWWADQATISASLYRSEEDDYRSIGGSLGVEWSVNDDLTSFSTSFSAYNDELFPSDAEEFGRIEFASKQRRSLHLGLSQVMSAERVLNLGLGYTQLDGFLSDPYKDVDVRPDSNGQFTATAKLRQFVRKANAAVHADYRYYNDDFGVRSHTLESRWHQMLGSRWQLVPYVRLYSQSAADFYKGYDFEQPDLTSPQSSDFRLSSYGALSAGVRVTATWDRWNFKVTAQRYRSDASWGLGSSVVSPALVDFNLFTIGLDTYFGD